MIDEELALYLLSVSGYVVLENALRIDEVNHLNSAIDSQHLPPPQTYERFGTAPLGSGFLSWDEAFVSLTDHASVRNLIKTLCGERVRLDRIHGVYREPHLNPGSVPRYEKDSVSQIGGSERVVSHSALKIMWHLTDSGPGIGGWVCLPGSHRDSVYDRANNESRELGVSVDLAKHQVTIDAPAGCAVLVQPTLRIQQSEWHGPHQCRVLVYSYIDSSMIPDTEPLSPS